MQAYFIEKRDEKTIPIKIIQADELDGWLGQQDDAVSQWVQANQYQAKPGTHCLVPNSTGDIACVLYAKEPRQLWSYAKLAASLPAGEYYLDADSHGLQQEAEWELALLGWGLGHYKYQRYLKNDNTRLAQLALPSHMDKQWLDDLLYTHVFVRDLINTPCEEMGPPDLADAAKKLAKSFSGKCKIISGDALLKNNFNTIHAVGRAAAREPRLIDITWGDKKHPKVTLVGKGVCFDTGGLDLKGAAGMREMKKDMGGAAHALGLACLIMSQKLPVRLRVLIPAVENSVSGNALRPGDVIRTHAGKTVEIHNTDAEGRLILCDALSEAVAEKPECLFDFATLTGAAFVALGSEIPACYSNNEALAEGVTSASQKTEDLLWRLPLHAAYKHYLKSTIADISNASPVPMAGSITAALYLQEFVPDDIAWMHFDMMASNPTAQPGRPKGAEVMAIRAVFYYLQERYGL